MTIRRSTMKLRPASQLAISLELLMLILAVPSVRSIRFDVVENTEAGETIGTLDFADSDISVYPCPELLTVEGNTLKTRVKFDREEILMLNETRNNILHCTAALSGNVVSIQIRVLDVNDNAPRFSELDQVHTLNITENFNIPNPILRLEPLDLDNGTNGTVDFYITAGNEENFFYIGPPLEYVGPDTSRLELFFNRSVDYETHKVFNLTIFMHDHGTPQLNFTQIIVIDINDVNDECPRFVMSVFDFALKENHTVGPQHPFAKAEAIDRDSIPSVMVFSLVYDVLTTPSDAFEYIAINNETGELYLRQAIDYETDLIFHHLEFSIQVWEQGMEANRDVANVEIVLKDVNEDSPDIRILRQSHSVPENQDLENAPFLAIEAYDPDGVDYPIVEVDPPLPVLTRRAGNLFTFAVNGALDRELVDHATFNITVHDEGSPSLAFKFTVELEVLDENDNPPQFTEVEYSTIAMETTPIHHVVATVQATDPDIGENGAVSYAIESVTPPIAESWFSIDSLTGNITVEATMNYTLANSVHITVTAEDNGTAKAYTTNASTTVNISISPSVTFKPWSYQEHCLPNQIKIQDTSTKVYLEFRTGEKAGLLLYEQSVEGENFVLGIQEGKVVAIVQNVIQSRFDGIDVSTNDWIAVLYDVEKKTLDVSYADQEENALRGAILRTYNRVRCDDSGSNIQTFYVGGIDAFSHFQNVSEYSDFVGTIRNVVIGSVLVDLTAPLREENTIRGALFATGPKCGAEEMTCSEPHHSGCLDYDFESHCICSGGFSSDTCAKKENYDPIQLSSSSKVKVAVDYALFVDLLQRSRLVDPTNTIPVTGNSKRRRRRRRRRRSIQDTSDYQLVVFQFRLLRESSGTLLYSRTRSSIHNLEITRSTLDSQPKHSIKYTISSAEFPSQIVYVHIAKLFEAVLGDVYTVSINMTTTQVHVSFNGTSTTLDWDKVVPFIEYPYTEIGIGGAGSSEATSNFSGCISQLSVNEIQFPLNGLVEHNDSSIQIVAGSTSSSVSTTCDLCQRETNPCSSPFECASNIDSYTCNCPSGLLHSVEGNDCIAPPITPTDKTLPITPTGTPTFPLYYYIAGAVGALVVAALLVTIVCCMCCRRKKQQNQKQTYHVGGEQQLPQLGSGVQQRSRANSYSDVSRRPSFCHPPETSYGMVSRHNHDGSSCTTCNDEDTESHLQHMIRSKSSTSGETGFHTASERDDQRSLPRMEDSGNEKDTDYSTPFESESDDSQSYVEMESPVPINIHRGNSKGRADLNITQFSSPSASLGPVSTIGAPLTTKEKKFITPLRPDSPSELGEETDLDTDFSSTVLPPQTAFYRNGFRGGSLKLPGRPDSGMSGHQWYKSSTSSDTERERKRAEASRAYYPPNPYQSIRRTRATSASSAQQAMASELVSPLPKCPSLTPPHLHSSSSRTKRETHIVTPPPISPLTNFSHRHRQHSTSPHLHKKGRESSKASDVSDFSAAAALSRSQPLKMHHPFFRQSSESPRVPAHLTTRHYVPSYMRSYSEESNHKEKKFVDLGSVRTNCDPIQYWEGQTRMMPTVDHQVDAYPVLSESFTPFEDSTAESQQSGPQHQSFASQGGGEGTAEALDIGLLHDCDTESVATGTTLKGSENESRMILFPSADCSEEYRCTPRMMSNLSSQSDSNLLQHCGSVPPSQGAFEV